MSADRRQSADFGKWIALTVGLFTLVGVLLGAGISYGRLQAQADRVERIEQRLLDLEKAQRYNHGDEGMLTHAPKDDQ